MTESKLTISWEKEGHIFCDFRFSSSFQKIDMILLTRPEGGLILLIGLISLILPGRRKRVGGEKASRRNSKFLLLDTTES